MKRISAMNLLRALLTVALTVLPCINVFSSEVLSFRSIPSKLLPTNAVRVLFSDSEGYVWIPTYSGLVRYDGSSTVVFGMNESDGEKFDCHINVVANRRGTSSGLHRKKAFTPWTRTMVRFPLQDQTHGWERSMLRTSAAPTGGMYG